MDSSFNAFSKVVTKHVLGSQERFNELKDRLAMCEHATSKAGAAALGYLMAMEEKESNICVWDEIQDLVGTSVNSTVTTDEIMLVMYKWLDKKFNDEGYAKDSCVRPLLRSWFEEYVP